MDSSVPSSAQRDWARRQLEKKRRLRTDFTGYVVINVFLVAIWAISGFGYFWPGWVLGGWGVLLALGAWNTYTTHPITESDIDRELQRHG
ncbi:2TM domain-containing protein [Actinomadura sp. ATCC 31491]|uniref:2TM domain-containing protein n=1 Tax=Actinomadura luzonensis TaxID=2805427 RepID=A0ABT0FJF4_9ACTN|nr:2TM domain-containing protein [Actinomadura luzonensis]MCK2212435.1 2TM domain-containing protein [Actinomadura luzonensis]